MAGINPPCMALMGALPNLRRALAHDLDKDGWSQARIARFLGITQPMVHRYLSEGEGDMDGFGAYLYERIVPMLKGRKEVDVRAVVERICYTCMDYRVKGSMCSTCALWGDSGGCDICARVFGPSVAANRVGSDVGEVLSSLEDGIRVLSSMGLGAFTPEVGINIVMGLKNAMRDEDFAGVPGRLRTFRGRIIPPWSVMFGASTHLSRFILALKDAGLEDIRACMNLKYVGGCEDVIEDLDLFYAVYRRKGDEDLAEAVAHQGLRAFKHWPEHGVPDIIIDHGGGGIEPCMYILGKSGIEVATRARSIINYWVERQKGGNVE